MFQGLIDTAQNFYRELDRNNSKQWWADNRAVYDDDLKPQATDMLASLSPRISDLVDAPVTSKLFRPHRDVRFSKDKTPYKTHLHMMWQIVDGQSRQSPVYFFGIGIDYVTVGTGIMAFDKSVLDDWRKFVDLDQMRVGEITKALKDDGFAFREPDLKRVPPPYPSDHPLSELLRMKGCVASRDIGSPPRLDDAVISAMTQATPLTQLLLQVAS